MTFTGYRAGPASEAAKTRKETFARIEAWDGRVRPFVCHVFVEGVWVGSTGFCTSEGRALAAAERIALRSARSEVVR